MSTDREMAEGDVLAVMDSLSSAEIEAWIAGAWAVDALVGEQTRRHRDLDLAIRSDRVGASVAALADLGFQVARDLRPVRLGLEASGGRSVDLHPVTFDGTGVGRQPGDAGQVIEYRPEGFGIGIIGGRPVRCLGAEQLVRFHLGYAPQGHDREDMAILRDRLGVWIPPPY
jgi:lincosamide nucleotidyltransferase A/C/D/E